MVGIYKIENNINHKIYIGQSKNIERRWKDHRSRIYYEANNNLPLYRAFRKYGIDNFSFKVVEQCLSEELDKKEKEYIQKFNSIAPNGYNVTPGGSSSYPQKLTIEQVKEIKKLLKTTTLNQTDIGNLFNVSQNAISDINTGYCWIDEKEDYPIRKHKFTNNQPIKRYFCIDCGKPISRGANRCFDCYAIFQQKVDRPNREELKKEIRDNTFVQVGKKYKVTDNTIRKWCKKYGLPSKAREIKKYTDDEWGKI